MTFKSPIFRKLFLSAVVVIGVMLVSLDFYLTRFTQQREVDVVRQQLETNARILAGELPNVTRPHLEDWALASGMRAHAWVTLITPSG